MELRYQMTDILPLLPIPQPPNGKSAYNIPCHYVTVQVQGRSI